MCVDVSTVIAGDVQSDSIYVASKDIYQLQYTPLSLCQWRQSFLYMLCTLGPTQVAPFPFEMDVVLVGVALFSRVQVKCITGQLLFQSCPGWDSNPRHCFLDSAFPTELPGQLSKQGSKSTIQHNTRQSQTPILCAMA